jgi:pimeloyl-ACP methyl ester carboxylesterase
MFVLVHSPLVGPATWRRVAQAPRWWGHDVTMPDLTEAAATGAPDAVIRAAIPPQATETPVLVGHSGAGFFLPSIAAVLEAPARRLVFVDAGIPPGEGEASAGADVLDRLRPLATDGVLPRWSTWWGEGVMETLVPDDARRAEIEAEMPEIPLPSTSRPSSCPPGGAPPPAPSCC